MISIKAASIATILLLSTLSLASSATFNASYDDLFTLPGEGALTPVGTYKGITYENFIVAEIPPGVLNESTSGVTPHSSPNVALARNPPNSLTGGPTTKSFSLSSVWYGCDLFSAQSLLAAAAPCTITVTGFKAGSSSPVATQVLSFTTSQTVSLSSPPAFATFSPKFKNLHSVNITVEPSDVIFLFDNLIGSTTS